jgi:hypothetical protein
VQTVLGEIGLFAALLYFGGWVYLNRYYSQFDIDVGLLEVDWHDVIVHSAALLKGGAVMMVKSPAVLSLLILPLMLWAAGHYLPRYAEIWKMAGISFGGFDRGHVGLPGCCTVRRRGSSPQGLGCQQGARCYQLQR